MAQYESMFLSRGSSHNWTDDSEWSPQRKQFSASENADQIIDWVLAEGKKNNSVTLIEDYTKTTVCPHLKLTISATGTSLEVDVNISREHKKKYAKDPPNSMNPDNED